MLPVALAQFSSGGVAILHVFPVFFHLYVLAYSVGDCHAILVTGTS